MPKLSRSFFLLLVLFMPLYSYGKTLYCKTTVIQGEDGKDFTYSKEIDGDGWFWIYERVDSPVFEKLIISAGVVNRRIKKMMIRDGIEDIQTDYINHNDLSEENGQAEALDLIIGDNSVVLGCAII